MGFKPFLDYLNKAFRLSQEIFLILLIITKPKSPERLKWDILNKIVYLLFLIMAYDIIDFEGKWARWSMLCAILKSEHIECLKEAFFADCFSHVQSLSPSSFLNRLKPRKTGYQKQSTPSRMKMFL